tara:strand:- start:35 stop:553 length:519 start_codon:yes stop_codon:yes gene_type:complete
VSRWSPIHNIDSDPYGLYNTRGEQPQRKIARFFETNAIAYRLLRYLATYDCIKRIGIGVWGGFKSRWGMGQAMMETLYIIGTIIVGFGVVLKLLIDLGHKIEDGLIELDEKLAMAIRTVVEKIPGLGEHEPINPIQMAIGQLIANMNQQKQQQPEMKVIQRDEKGLFTSQDS